MTSNRFSVVLLLTAGALTTGYMGCSSDDPSSPAGAGGATSNSVSSSRSSSAHSSSRASSTGQVPVPPAEHLGKACTSDADCGDQGQCLLESSNDTIFGGGPAGGYCTASCQQDSDCEGLGSFCAGDGSGTNLCILGCEPGGSGNALDPDKCQGRGDLACVTNINGQTFCRPLCGSDDQCLERFCNPQSTTCQDTAPRGLPQNAACNPNAMTDPCTGGCVPLTSNPSSTVGACFNFCVVSAPLEVSCGGPAEGLCAYISNADGPGDLALCAPACKAHSDCANPRFFCEDFGIPNNGYCFLSVACTRDADCEQPRPGTTCTEVPGGGKFCVDPQYPLDGSGGSSGDGGSGGAGASGGSGGSGAAGGSSSSGGL